MADYESDDQRVSSAGSESNRNQRPSISSTPQPSMTSGDNVKVVCRVRPFNRREIDIHEEMNSKCGVYERCPLRSVLTMTDKTTTFLDHHNDYAVKEGFNFNENLWSIPAFQQEADAEFCTQQTVFDRVGQVTLGQALQGFNTCIFAYGQTGSGKTHTMMGTEEEKGLIPKCCEGLFERIKDLSGTDISGNIIQWKVEAKFLEIYNEHVKDCLWELADPTVQQQYDQNNLRVRNIPGQGPYVVGLTSIVVESWDECQDIIATGMKNRVVAATKMNDTSSRSHAVFRLTLTQTTTIKPAKQWEKPKMMDRAATINLVDLAGSERLKKSGAEGQRLKEAAAINLSLTTLKNVIDALVERRPLIPYRDSQLTWLLSESLGGNSKTFMIACCSPHSDNAEETLNTMRYALRTQGIVCHARVNESDEARRIAALQKELANAQKALQSGDEGVKVNLRRQMEGNHDALAEMHKKQYKRMAEEKELISAVQREREKTYSAVFGNAFRSRLFERIADKVSKRRETITQEVEQMDSELSNVMTEMALLDKNSAKLNQDLNELTTAHARAEKLYAVASQQITDTNEATKETQEHISEIEQYIVQAKSRFNFTQIFCFARGSTTRNRYQRDADELAATHAHALQQCSRQSQSEKGQIQMLNQRNIKNLQKDMQIINDEMAQVTQQIQCTNEDRKTQFRKHSEDITFFERENRNIDDERVQKLTQIDRTQAQRYQAETARLSERSVKGRQIIEQRNISFMHEAARQITVAGVEHNNALTAVDQQWGGRLEKVQGETHAALTILGQQYMEVIKAHDCQINDAKTYLHEWQHAMMQYGTVFNEIQEIIANGGNNYPGTADVQPLKDLIRKLEVSNSIFNREEDKNGSHPSLDITNTQMKKSYRTVSPFRTSSPTGAFNNVSNVTESHAHEDAEFHHDPIIVNGSPRTTSQPNRAQSIGVTTGRSNGGSRRFVGSTVGVSQGPQKSSGNAPCRLGSRV